MSIASIEGKRRGRAHIFMLPDMSATSYVYTVIRTNTMLHTYSYLHTYISYIEYIYSY